MSEYTDRADALLKELGVEFTAWMADVNECPPQCPDRGKPRGEFPRKTHIHGDHWRCRVSRGNQEFTFSFWDSYVDAEARWVRANWHRIRWGLEFEQLRYKIMDGKVKMAGIKPAKGTQGGILLLPPGSKEWPDKIPSAYSALSCLPWFMEIAFNSWAEELGYNNDSIKARDIFLGELELYGKITSMFTEDERGKLAEVMA